MPTISRALEDERKDMKRYICVDKCNMLSACTGPSSFFLLGDSVLVNVLVKIDTCMYMSSAMHSAQHPLGDEIMLG